MNESISYAEKLRHPMWIKARNLILFRDDYMCQKCGAKQVWKYELHVHHKRYINGMQPWEYSPQDLITLCKRCHEKEHGIYQDYHLKHVREYMKKAIGSIQNGQN